MRGLHYGIFDLNLCSRRSARSSTVRSTVCRSTRAALSRREDDAPVQAMKAELRTLEAKQAELENILASAQPPAPLIHPALAEVYRRHVATLNDALRDPNSRDEAFEIIRSLIDEIRLIPEDGARKIERCRNLQLV
jgi:hypothetical protein